MIVILNSAAGRPGEESRRAIEEIFGQMGLEMKIVEAGGGRSLKTLAREAARGSEETVVAAGGDGTLNAVAAELVESGKILGVLPMGTLNHFAKDLGIPTVLSEAVQTLIGGRVTEVDVGEVNGRIFLNNSGLGLYPRIVRRREIQQEFLGRGKWPAFLWAAWDALKRYPFLDLRIRVDGEPLFRRTAFLFVGNNAYEMEGFGMGERRRLNAGKLGLYFTHRTGRLGLLRLACRALAGRLEQARDFESHRASDVWIEARQNRLLVSVDGEVQAMDTPLHYRIRPRGLRVWVPAEISR